ARRARSRRDGARARRRAGPGRLQVLARAGQARARARSGRERGEASAARAARPLARGQRALRSRAARARDAAPWPRLEAHRLGGGLRARARLRSTARLPRRAARPVRSPAGLPRLDRDRVPTRAAALLRGGAAAVARAPEPDPCALAHAVDALRAALVVGLPLRREPSVRRGRPLAPRRAARARRGRRAGP